jgi:hypothetical protein
MFFSIKNKRKLAIEQLRTTTLLNAYYIIQKYPLHASDLALDRYIQQQYKTSLKDLCVKLLLNMTFYEDKEGNLVLLFKNTKYDKLARLITYGNGAIPGSCILKLALTN